ncbi:MAG: sulfotransferase domain-containing protein [Microcoleaceae cyanobacterium]
MIFVCYGMVKSASTFAFQLANHLAQTHSNQAELNQLLPEHLQARFIPKNLGETLQKLNSYLPNNGEIYVIKTHCFLDDETKKMLSEGKVKAAVSYRDPYDIVVSLKDAGEIERQREEHKQRPYFTEIQSYEDALKKLPPVLKEAKLWLDCEDTMQINFSRIANEPVVIAQEIADYMGVNIDPQKIVKIVESYTSDKSSIFEFNKGIEGRGQKELNLSDTDPIKKTMDEFVSQYLSKVS